MPDKKLLSVREGAAFLGVAPSTLYQKAARGLIPRVVLWRGKKKEAIRFTEDMLMEYVKQHSVPGRPVDPHHPAR